MLGEPLNPIAVLLELMSSSSCSIHPSPPHTHTHCPQLSQMLCKDLATFSALNPSFKGFLEWLLFFDSTWPILKCCIHPNHLMIFLYRAEMLPSHVYFLHLLLFQH